MSAIEIKNEDLYRIFLIIWLIGGVLTLIFQLFLTQIVADSSLWELSLGWQHEIGLWAGGIIFAILFALIQNNVEINKYLMMVLMVLSGILGSYNLYSLITMESFELMNFFWILGNYVMVGLGVYILYMNRVESY